MLRSNASSKTSSFVAANLLEPKPCFQGRIEDRRRQSKSKSKKERLEAGERKLDECTKKNVSGQHVSQSAMFLNFFFPNQCIFHAPEWQNASDYVQAFLHVGNDHVTSSESRRYLVFCI